MRGRVGMALSMDDDPECGSYVWMMDERGGGLPE